jgi:Tol biopolymer transport system component
MQGLFVRNASGTGAEETALRTEGLFLATDVSRDGSTLVGQLRREGLRWDVVSVGLSGNGEIANQVTGPFAEFGGKLSPDGRYLAYVSTESGELEVYLTTFPAGGGKWQVSQSGGAEPTWRADGKEPLPDLTSVSPWMSVTSSVSQTLNLSSMLAQPPTRPYRYAAS